MTSLLTILLGSFVSNFTGYFNDPPTATREQFEKDADRLS